MNLTVDGLIEAILSARRLEKLQEDLREAMIDQLVRESPPPTQSITSGAPAPFIG